MCPFEVCPFIDSPTPVSYKSCKNKLCSLKVGILLRECGWDLWSGQEKTKRKGGGANPCHPLSQPQYRPRPNVWAAPGLASAQLEDRQP